jgi:hypothetical protein
MPLFGTLVLKAGVPFSILVTVSHVAGVEPIVGPDNEIGFPLASISLTDHEIVGDAGPAVLKLEAGVPFSILVTVSHVAGVEPVVGPDNEIGFPFASISLTDHEMVGDVDPDAGLLPDKVEGTRVKGLPEFPDEPAGNFMPPPVIDGVFALLPLLLLFKETYNCPNDVPILVIVCPVDFNKPSIFCPTVVKIFRS